MPLSTDPYIRRPLYELTFLRLLQEIPVPRCETSTSRQGLQHSEYLEESQEDAHRRAAVRVRRWDVPQGLQSPECLRAAQADAHGREAVHLRLPGLQLPMCPGRQFENTQNQYAIDASHVAHMSMSEGLDSNFPFGTSILETVFKTFKQKEMLEDAIIKGLKDQAKKKSIKFEKKMY